MLLRLPLRCRLITCQLRIDLRLIDHEDERIGDDEAEDEREQ